LYQPLRVSTGPRNLIEDISQLKQIALGEGAAVCEACGAELREGAPLIAFAFRPAERSGFTVGHVKCVECRLEPTEYFTLGVRELVLEGRVGTCSDPATQSSWHVLLAPRPRAVSAADSTAVELLPGSTWFRRPVARSEFFVAADCDADGESSRRPWERPVVRADDAADSTRCARDDGRSGGARR
jgi:hypothetical protein